MDEIEWHLSKVTSSYLERPWQLKKKPNIQKTKPPAKPCKGLVIPFCIIFVLFPFLGGRPTCSKDGCDCTSYGQCVQNAEAYLATADYVAFMKQKEDAIIAEAERQGLPKPKDNVFQVQCAKPKPFVKPKITGRCHRDADFKCASVSANHRVFFFVYSFYTKIHIFLPPG